MTDSCHFAQRCKERGVPTEDPLELKRMLEWWIDSGMDEFAQFVTATHKARFWRFRVNGCIFYAATGLEDSIPRTVYTQRMMRQVKDAKKDWKRGKPRRYKHWEVEIE